MVLLLLILITVNGTHAFAKDVTWKGPISGGIYESGTITISGDCSVNGQIVIDGIVTIESLNGVHTMTRDVFGDLIIVEDGATLILINVIIDGNNSAFNNAKNGSLVRVNNGGTIEIRNGAVLRNNLSTGNGGGVSMEGGTLNMNGGEIRYNGAIGVGGGVFIDNGIFNMSDGAIVENEASVYGGGVFLVNGTFNMNDGKITDNSAWTHGGGVFADKSSFNMRGGEIENNSADTNGGGLFVNDSVVTLSNGKINYNQAELGGGAYLRSNSAFTMINGEIINNTVPKNGAGVCVTSNSKFSMTGGEISATGEESTPVYVKDAYTHIEGEAKVSVDGFFGSAVFAYGDICDVIVGGNAQINSMGDCSTAITSHGDVIVTGNAQITTTGDESRAIMALGNTTISENAQVCINGIFSFAVHSNGNTTVDGNAKITVIGDLCFAVMALGNVNVGGNSQIIATGEYNRSIFTNGDITVRNNAVIYYDGELNDEPQEAFAHFRGHEDKQVSVDISLVLRDNAIYIEKSGILNHGSKNDLIILPSNATAVWDTVGGKTGISYALGDNTGFFEVPGEVAYTTPIAKETLINPFTDVYENDWYITDVSYVYSNGLLNGTSTNPMLFNPSSQLTRGMVATVLYRMENCPDTEGLENQFNDVPDEEWYTDAVKWAAANGIVTGYDNLFNPITAINREQLATMLYRYAEINGTVPYIWVVGVTCSDEEDISFWALDGVLFLYKKGIIKGKPGELFDPAGKATRAEFAAIMHRYSEIMKAN